MKQKEHASLFLLALRELMTYFWDKILFSTQSLIINTWPYFRIEIAFFCPPFLWQIPYLTLTQGLIGIFQKMRIKNLRREVSEVRF